jgi:hypothetical protein
MIFFVAYFVICIGNSSFLTDSKVMLQQKEWIDKQTAAILSKFFGQKFPYGQTMFFFKHQNLAF